MSNTYRTEHDEFLQQIDAYLAGGLDPAERAAFDAHLAGCASCAAALEQATHLDRSMEDLFAGARPGVGFEDRVIQRFRAAPAPRRLIHPAMRRAVSGVAAVLVLGTFGYMANHLLQEDRLPSTTGLARHLTFAPGAVDGEERAAAGMSAGKPAEGHAHGSADSAARELWERLRKGRTWRYDENGNGRVEDESGATWFKSRASEEKWAEGKKLDQLDLDRYVDGDADYGYRRKLGKLAGQDGEAQEFEEVVDKHSDGIAGTAGVERFGRGGIGGGGFGGMAGNGSIQVQMGQAGEGDGLSDAPHSLYSEVRGNAQAQSHFYGYAKVPSSAPPAATNVDYFLPMMDDAKSLAEADSEQREEVLGKVLALGPATPRSSNTFDVSQLTVAFRNNGGAAGEDPLQGQAQTVPARPNGPATEPGAAATQPQEAVQATMAGRKIIRNGEMEFEVDSFDSSFIQITRIVGEEGGFVSSTGSEKLPNGKVRGSVVVRVPPERLDTLVLKLRALGDLKSQRISAQDVTKVYNDLESELRAGRAMEERLLEIIKSGKGEIKDLLEAEKQLGVYREKIEKLEGEIRYYNNLVSLSTLSITLAERDIRTAAYTAESEQVGVGIETDEVEEARNEAIKAIEEAKGRIIESSLKRHDAGQLAATVVAEVSPDSAGPVIDRLRQLGRVARLDMERKQTAPAGTSVPPGGVRIERGETRFAISIYNLANIAPRQTSNLNLAVADVEEAYRSIIETALATGGRIVTSTLNRQKPEQTTASISFEVPAAEAEAALLEIRRAREVMSLTVTENPDTRNVTAAKRGFMVQILSLAAIAPREMRSLAVAAADVPSSYQTLLSLLQERGARIITAQLNEQDRRNITGILDFEVLAAERLEIDTALAAAGAVYSRSVTRSPDTQSTVDSKVRMQVSLTNVSQLPPRERVRMVLEVTEVEKRGAEIIAASDAAGGRTIDSSQSKTSDGEVTSQIILELPLSQAEVLRRQVRSMGELRVLESTRNPQAPDGQVGRAQFAITLATPERIVGRDAGLTASLKNALATSVKGLLWSLQLIVIGLLFVGPWALLLWALWRAMRRRPAAEAAPATA